MSADPKAELSELKQRLSGLTEAQRAELARRLGGDRSGSAARAASPAAIPRARPLRLAAHPADGDADRQVAVYPASHGQQRMWFLHHYAPAAPVYNCPTAFRLLGPLSVARLEKAFAGVIQRHDTLRTTFALEDGGLVQRIATDSTFQLQQVNLEETPAEVRSAAAERCVEEVGCRSFDLGAEPPFRAVLVRLQPEEHVLLVVQHHIISDGWSRANLWRELSVLYEGPATTGAAPVRELPVQFADYSAWQKDWLESGALDEQTAYWKTRLAGPPKPLDLPSDRPRPAAGAVRGGCCSLPLDPGLMDGLKTRAQEEGATLFMILLAAFKTLLHRYTGRDDLVVGVPVANRPRAELEGLIGFFVNTLVLRTDFSGAPTFRELLRRVKDNALEAYAHQDLPFERLVELAQVRRDPSRTPLFQTTFALQDFPEGSLQIPGLQTTPWPVGTHTARFDLSLAVERSAEGWTATAEYSTDLFEAGRIERLLGHWRVLLESIVTDPAQRVSDLPLLTEAERQQVLFQWNSTEVIYPQEGLLPTLLQKQARRSPDAVAALCQDRSLSYAELDRASARLACRLRHHGVGPDVLVGVCLERSVELMAALWGVWRAGGAYVPLDTSYPADRLAFMLQDAAPAMLLTHSSLLDRLPPQRAHILCLDELWPELTAAGEAEAPDLDTLSPKHLAYMIYTSGSTGRPKGALNSHEGIRNRLLWMQQEYRLGAEDVVLQKTPLGFDVSVWELFWPGLVGARLVLARPEGHKDPAYLAQLIEAHAVTVCHFVPPMLQAFLSQPRLQQSCRSLRQVMCSGEALARDLAERCFEALPDVRLHNLYGPTEAAVDVTFGECQAGQPGPVPIGRPLANTTLYVLDQHLQPVPLGVPGELYIGGVQVGRGYHHRPELTAERFLPDPFAEQPGRRLYRTGDLGRWLPGGVLEYLGRTDYQVKLRGFRIELGEIEARLLEHAAVREAVVVAREDSPGDKRLVAYLVADQTAPTPAALRDFLKQKLPDYMVPSAFVMLERLPLTPNGKIDRKVLPVPELDRAGVSQEYVAPRTPIEEVLAGIWGEVLKVKHMSVHDNFFELGGHSLRATQVVARIRRSLEVDVPLRALFEFPTIARLAEQLPGFRGESVPSVPTLAPMDRPLPMSIAQQRLWSLDQLHGTSTEYNLPEALRLRGQLNCEALERAINALVERQESLRTHFVEVEGEPVQVVTPSLRIAMPMEDLSTLEESQREEAITAALRREREEPFDLARGPLLRIRLLVLGEHEHILLPTCHHIVSDSWSRGVFHRELAALYEAFCDGRDNPLAPLPVQYADYAVWQRQWLQGEALQRQLDYWRQQLAEAPTLALPTDRPRPARQTYSGARHRFVVPAAVGTRLHAFHRSENITPFMSLLAAFEVLLSRSCGQVDILVGTPIANRQRVELENLIGFFVNTLVLRGDLSGQPGFRAVAARVRRTALEAYQHQDLPFETLVAELNPERDLSRNPLFQVLFALQNAPVHPLALAGVEVSPQQWPVGSTHVDLELHLWAEGDTWAGSFVYNTDLFDAATIERMAGHFQTLLASLLAEPERPVSEVPMLADAERQQLLVQWNDTAVDYPRDRCIQELFEEQAAKTPEAVAVVFEDRSLTYRQLNERANQLAHHLRTLGVGPDVLVGVYLKRSPELVVGLLGILKAGGAYVPLATDYPLERLRFMLEDTGRRLS